MKKPSQRSSKISSLVAEIPIKGLGWSLQITKDEKNKKGFHRDFPFRSLVWKRRTDERDAQIVFNRRCFHYFFLPFVWVGHVERKRNWIRTWLFPIGIVKGSSLIALPIRECVFITSFPKQHGCLFLSFLFLFFILAKNTREREREINRRKRGLWCSCCCCCCYLVRLWSSWLKRYRPPGLPLETRLIVIRLINGWLFIMPKNWTCTIYGNTHTH